MDDVVQQLQDLRHLSWREQANTSGTSGMFLKAREGKGPDAVYYKLSCYDSYRGIYGHECVNELVAARLAGALGIEHAKYSLVHGLVSIDGIEYETWLSQSPSYRREGERKQALDLYFDLHRISNESPLEFCKRMGWGEQVREMLVFDYLIANRDRHGANIEVLRSKDGELRLAPLFDNGLSFAFSCYGDEVRLRSFDPLQDVNVNNYLGTRSLEENLRFVRPFPQIHGLEKSDVERLTAGLVDAASPMLLGTIRRIVWERWCRLEDLRNL